MAPQQPPLPSGHSGVSPIDMAGQDRFVLIHAMADELKELLKAAAREQVVQAWDICRAERRLLDSELAAQRRIAQEPYAGATGSEDGSTGPARVAELQAELALLRKGIDDATIDEVRLQHLLIATSQRCEDVQHAIDL
jgi:hypothetical protein